MREGEDSPAQDDAATSWLRGVVWVTFLRVAVLMALPLLCYIPALSGPFIWDDNHMLYNNPLIHAGFPDGLFDFWFSAKNFDFFPLTSTTLWIEWRLWGVNPMGYRVVNILLHGLSAVLIWRILARLRVSGAWLIGLIFAVHPVAVASVAWIAERKNTLSTAFGMLALLWFLRYEAKAEWFLRHEAMAEKGVAGRLRWYLLSYAAFLAGLFSKTAIVTLPAVMLILAWWQRGKLTWRDVARTAPFFLTSLVLGLVTIWFQYGKAIGRGIVRPEGFFSRLAGTGWALWFYLYKTFLPFNLCMVYPRWKIDPTLPLSFLPLFLYLALIALLWRFRRTWGRHGLAGLGYHVVTLFPVLGFLKIYFMRFSLVGDHWQYLSFVGPVALVVGAVGHWSERSSAIVRRAVTGLAAAAVVVLCVLSWKQALLYADEKELWRHNTRLNPEGWVAYNNLGILTQLNPEQAISHFQKAVALNPRYQEAYFGLGMALRAVGQREQAIESFRKAVALRPDYFVAQNALGLTYMELCRFKEAVPHFEQAVATRPAYAEPYVNAGVCLAVLGDAERAKELIVKGIGFGFPRPTVHYRLGVTWLELGRKENAKEQFLESLSFGPSSSAHVNLATILVEQDKPEEALGHYEAALRLQPDFMEAHYNIANLFFSHGHFDRAAQHYEAVIRLNPRMGPAYHNLANSLFSLGQTNAAISVYNETIQRFPDMVAPYNSLGMILASMGRLNEALQCYVWALERVPDYTDARINMAAALRAGGQDEAALEQYRLLAEGFAAAGGMTQALEFVGTAIELAEQGELDETLSALCKQRETWEAAFESAAPPDFPDPSDRSDPSDLRDPPEPGTSAGDDPGPDTEDNS